MTRLTDLSQPELDVLLMLAQARVTASAVTLAADLWRETGDWMANDPYPLITYVLDSLSSRGLVRYTLRELNFGRDLPTKVRLTPKGWELLGYGNKTVEVGSLGRHERQPLHPGDMTDYLNLDAAAIGGPIEVEDFPTHRDRFPHHQHMYGVPILMANAATHPKPRRSRAERLADPTVLQDPDGDGSRGYIRVTPDMEAMVIAARSRMGTVSYGDVAEAVGLPERTIRYILTDLPRLRRANGGDERLEKSLKERVFATIEVLGEVKDVAELRRILGMADPEHDVMHVLHSLHTQGRIDFVERGTGNGDTTVIHIRPTKKGTKRLTQTQVDALPEIVAERLPEAVQPLPVISREEEERAISAAHNAETGFEATTPDTPVTAPSAPEPESEGYPLLDALLDRERTRLDGDSKGMAFVVAAEAIQAIDPDTARSLMEKAKQYDVPFPSPIEQEYLRYVATHPPVVVADEQ
jgi:DNA-binding MarR family transcriptional regulator/DNA-binding PadR family transcriptional regulator